MNITARTQLKADVSAMARTWNPVVNEGVSFSQSELLEQNAGRSFFAGQGHFGLPVDQGEIFYGLYGLRKLSSKCC